MLVLDANVLLEVLEKRRFYDAVLYAFEHYAKQGTDLAVSTLTVSTVFYMAEKHKIAVTRVEKLVASYKFIDVIAADVDWALMLYKGRDFEDALQVAAAVRAECTVFLTLDAALSQEYSKHLNIQVIGG